MKKISLFFLSFVTLSFVIAFSVFIYKNDGYMKQVAYGNGEEENERMYFPESVTVESEQENINNQEQTEEPVQEEDSFVTKIVNFINPPKYDEAGLPLKVDNKVPFTSQAPYAQWDDDRYQDACEEASILMALSWVNGKDISKDYATEQIALMASWEKQTWGSYHDSSTLDTKRLLTEFYNYDNVKLFYDVGVQDIKKQLASGNVVIIPADGRELKNPYFTPPGPEIHMLLIRGYDEKAGEFITNDPGTKRGEGFRYKYKIIENAWRDYNTGYHLPITKIRTAMLVVGKK
jgi:uncharacterized protein YvpB